MEEMNTKQDELKEEKYELTNKVEELSKIHALNESLSKEVHKWKNEKNKKIKWERMSRGKN